MSTRRNEPSSEQRALYCTLPSADLVKPIFIYNKQCFGEIKNYVFFRTGTYFFSIFEPLGGLDTPMAQTKAPAKRKSSYYFRIDPSFCGTVRVFLVFFHNYGEQRCSPESTLGAFRTVGRHLGHYSSMYLCDRTSKGFCLSHGRIESMQGLKNKAEIRSRS